MIELFDEDGNGLRYLIYNIYGEGICVQPIIGTILERGGDWVHVRSKSWEHEHIIKRTKNGDCVLHCIDAPARITPRYVNFFINGFTTTIEDLPISDEEKVVLKLKYGDHVLMTNGFYSYHKI